VKLGTNRPESICDMPQSTSYKGKLLFTFL
jgi:hypothetical protein